MLPISFNSVLIIAGISVFVPAVLGLLPGLPVPGAVLEVIAGYDPKDELTAFSVGRLPAEPYRSFANERTLNGMRIGVGSPMISVNMPIMLWKYVTVRRPPFHQVE